MQQFDRKDIDRLKPHPKLKDEVAGKLEKIFALIEDNGEQLKSEIEAGDVDEIVRVTHRLCELHATFAASLAYATAGSDLVKVHADMCALENRVIDLEMLQGIARPGHPDVVKLKGPPDKHMAY